MRSRIGGCEFVDAAKALGCWVDDGRPHLQTKPTLAAVAAGDVANGVMLTDTDRALMVAANRINSLVYAFT